MFGLAPYRVTVTNQGKLTPLTPQDEQGLVAWVAAHLSGKVGALNAFGDNRLLRVARLCQSKDKTTVCGIYQTGESGFESELVDSETNFVSHQRQLPEAELIPFFFALFVPKGAKSGVMLLQRFRNLGIRGFLIPSMIDAFEKTHKGYRLNVEPLVPQTMMKTILENSDLKTLRLVQYSIPSAIEDMLSQSGAGEAVSSVEITINAKRNKKLGFASDMIELIEGKKNFADFATIPNWDFDTIKVEVELAGRSRVLDISKPLNLNPNIDITNEVAVAKSGHPEWESILNYSRDFAADVFAQHMLEAKFGAEFELDIEAADLELSEKAKSFALKKEALPKPKRKSPAAPRAASA